MSQNALMRFSAKLYRYKWSERVLFWLACNLSSYVLGPLMWLFVGFDIYYLIQQNWIQVPLLTLLAVLCFLACCAEGVVQYLLESLRDGMISFIRS